ncbi:MAG TPA: M56 family metallopeptidase [Candidatus Scatomorpha merdigallinarum]|nr:M56 family metallopeptidase [Candidatus Scatomorpha merdigallinarum]
MENIWEFIYQTLNVSLVAAVLLLVKWMLLDKLSPRWQYGVWCVLALRMLLPSPTQRGIIPPLAMWLEKLKSAAELNLGSAYTQEFGVIDLTSALPEPSGLPVSVTDWLFALYVAGVVVSLAWYAYRYARLRVLLWRGQAVSDETAAAIERVAGQYSLRPCRAVEVPGLSSAFVCGVIRPVLAVPEGAAPDDKILLHELLHLKYLDALQNVFWCCLRALHWCNPFLQYVFDRVGNDMESLCDQRVLERLQGEERREYGAILLEMASASYARAPGTSSISNGSKNIARRIEAIARFKLYPRGMALVSVCAVLVLGSTLLTGAQADYNYNGRNTAMTTTQAASELAETRINRPTTVAGALNTYAWGLLRGDALTLAMATPLSEQEQWFNSFSERENGTYSPIIETSFSELLTNGEPVEVMNLRSNGSGGYFAELVAPGFNLSDEGDTVIEFCILPVEVLPEGENWVVRETGAMHRHTDGDLHHSTENYGRLVTGSAELSGGTVTVNIFSIYQFANFNSSAPDLSDEFNDFMTYNEVIYYRDRWDFGGPLAHSVTVEYELLSEYESSYQLPITDWASGTGVFGGTERVTDYITNTEPKTIRGMNGYGTSDFNALPAEEPPAACAVNLYADGQYLSSAVIRLEAPA